MSKIRHVPHSAPLIGEEEIGAAERVLRSGYLAQGREVAAFENECAALVGRMHGVAVSSGTAALHLALLAAGIDAKSTVAIPSYVCTALLNAVLQAGAAAAIHDVGDDFNPGYGATHSRDVLFATHLFGKTGTIPPDAEVIEDLAHALGGAAGRRGRIAVASFYATKLMTSGGEGGMVLTDDGAVAERVRDLRDYDNRSDYRLRFNYKMTDLAAAIGRQQLKKLPSWIERRRAIAALYTTAFEGLPLALPNPADHVFFRYVVASTRREELERHLNERGIQAKRPVYRPLHQYDLPKDHVVLDEVYPGADRAHEQALSIPLNPGMSRADTEHVVNSVVAFF